MHPFYENREKKLDMYINKGTSFPEHLHEHVEILLVAEGQVEVTIAEECRTLFSGDCAIIFPGQIHSYRSHAVGRHLLLLFDPSLSESYSHVIRKFLPVCPFLPAASLSSDISLAFDRLLPLSGRYADKGPHSEGHISESTRFGQDSYGSPLSGQGTCGHSISGQGTCGHSHSEDTRISLACAWIHVLLANLMPLLQLKERKQPESTELTHRLVLYIMEHFQEPLSLNLLAAALHVNKYYLSHVFSEHFKMGFRQYLNQIRLNHALHAMQTTNLSITQIWADAGFNSQRSFNRFFLESVGMTPMEYRKSLRND